MTKALATVQTESGVFEHVPDLDFKVIANDYRKLEAKAIVHLNEVCSIVFKQGCLLKDIVGAEDRYGQGLMQTFAHEVEIRDVKRLYKAHAIAKSLDYSEAAFKEYVKSLGNKRLTISGMLRDLVQPSRNPESLGGMQHHAEALANDIEDLGRKIETAREFHGENQEMQGVLAKADEVLEETVKTLIGNRGLPAISKGPKLNSDFFKRWMHHQPDIITGEEGPCDPNHLILRKQGGSDFTAVPMKRSTHDEWHIDPDEFFARYNVTAEQLVAENIMNFINWTEQLLVARNINPFNEYD